MNFYKLMNPLHGVDVSTFPPESMVHALWKEGSDDHQHRDDTSLHQIMVFLSPRSVFGFDYLLAPDGSLASSAEEQQERSPPDDVILLWDESSSTNFSIT